MSTTMTREKGYWSSLGGAGYCNWGRGMSPGSERVDFGDISEILKGVESCSADNAQSDLLCEEKLVIYASMNRIPSKRSGRLFFVMKSENRV